MEMTALAIPAPVAPKMSMNDASTFVPCPHRMIIWQREIWRLMVLIQRLPS